MKIARLCNVQYILYYYLIIKLIKNKNILLLFDIPAE